MLTIENLRGYGANVDEGVKRCLDDEDFYIDLVKSAIPDERIDELEQCIKAGELDKAFEIAHALKGMYGNISITPIYEPISEITELLPVRHDLPGGVERMLRTGQKRAVDEPLFQGKLHERGHGAAVLRAGPDLRIRRAR